MKQIILNWMPPGMVETPSPAMSVLKQNLVNNGYSAYICYWNITLMELQKEFVWWPHQTTIGSEIYAELIFNNYLAIRKKDKAAYSKVKSVLISLKPQYLDADLYFFDRHMETYACALEKTIDEELRKFDFKNILYLGMSVNLYQWLCASIISERIKMIAPYTPIVIGGIGTKESAISFLKTFPYFDIAMWGEGEYNLLKLTQYFNDKETSSIEKLQLIPNIAYKNMGEIKVSSSHNHEFINLNSPDIDPHFYDYFEQLSLITNKTKIDVFLFVEGSRSCHWRKCHFCYLNTGYKHRLKDVHTIKEQIVNMITKYDVYRYSFLDNDLIGNDWSRFSLLLDSLLEIKAKYPDFRITLAEIITKDIDASYIRKMSLAGFEHVQIGYESASNTLLKKIDKKNTFASNLLFIKYADKYNIVVGGANIIRGLLEETFEDILEAIENLRTLRFFFQRGVFKHSMSNLGVMSSSRYFKSIKDNLSAYRDIENVEFLPEGYINNEELQKCNINEKIRYNEKITWTHFSIVENYYIKSIYSYKLYNTLNSLIYKESLNGALINELEIEFDSLEYLILKNSNQAVLSFDKLEDLIKNSEYSDILDSELFNMLEELKKEGLIYTPCDYSEIVSIIDIDNAI